ncbi:unnamed protein product, partial [Urochloa humidicola]
SRLRPTSVPWRCATWPGRSASPLSCGLRPPACLQSPSAGTSRPLTSGSYQGGRNNGAGFGSRKPLTDAYLDNIEAELAASGTVKKALSDQAVNLRSVIWSGAAGLGLGLFTIGLTVWEEKRRARAFRFG